MATATTTPKQAAKAAPADLVTTSADTLTASARPAYLVAGVEESTGEETWVNRFRYLPGHPRQVRFDAKAGQFNINGTVPLGSAISFIPLAWRIFQDDILNMGRKTWAELYFTDEKGAVCAVLFHGYSVENLYRLIEPLFYDDLTLADVVVTVTAAKKETTKEGKKATYFIAEFSYAAADPAEAQARKDFARDFALWRAETYTGLADVKLAQGYTVPQAAEQPLRLEQESEPQNGVSQAA